MIIWGSKTKTKTVNSGKFFCPNCKDETSYTQIYISKYFTLYFIPLFETEKLGEYVRCDRCNSNYKPEILNYSKEELLGVSNS